MTRTRARSRHPEPERGVEEDAKSHTATESPGGADAVLSLQRSAGNAAVSAWLRAAPPGLLQRDRKVADDVDTLAELGPVLKDIVIDDDSVGISGRAWYFKNPRLPARPGIGVETRFGGPMAAKDKSKEKALQDGLGSLAMMMFGLDGEPPKKKGEEDWGKLEPKAPKTATPKKPRPPIADLTRIVDLNLTDFGGQDGRYRFTAVTVKGTGDKPTEVILIVELIGARRQAFKSWGELDAKRKGELESRFKRFGFTKRMPREVALGEDPDLAMPWLDDQWGKVLQALELIPDDVLSGVTGIDWERGRGGKSPKGEGGLYTTNTGLPQGGKADRKLIIYDDAFKSDDALIRLVAHEVGHAVSMKPQEPAGGAAISAGADYQRAAKDDGGTAITKYGKTDWAEHYAEAYSMFVAEPATMKVMRPKLYEWFTKNAAGQTTKPPPAKKPVGAK